MLSAFAFLQSSYNVLDVFCGEVTYQTKEKILSMEDPDLRCHGTRCEATAVCFLLFYKVNNNNWDVSIHSVVCRMRFAVFLLNRLDQFLFLNSKEKKRRRHINKKKKKKKKKKRKKIKMKKK